MNGEKIPQRLLNPEDIAACAYLIWEKEGKPHGRAAEHWLQAEALLRAMRAADAQAAKEFAKTAPPAGKSTGTRKRKSRHGAGSEGATA
ncbi:MAG: DUF2934 domain-containing protein [Verrucomicrobiia bacterium]